MTTTHQTAVTKTPDDLKSLKDNKKEPATIGYAGDHRARLKGAGLHPDPRVSSDILGAKFPKGPGMTPEQYAVVERFSRSKTGNGQIWLSEPGLFTVKQAEDYLKARKFQAWLRLDAANRVLLAYVAWRRRGDLGDQVVRGTPAYRLGRSMDAKDPAVDKDRRKDAGAGIDADIRDEWAATVDFLGAPNQDAKDAIAAGGARDHEGKKMSEKKVVRLHETGARVLERVLILLHLGLQVYDLATNAHVDYEGSVVRALSHGGRVTVRIPQIVSPKEANQLLEWLGVTSKSGKLRGEKGYFERSFGTHHQAIGKNTHGQAGTGRFVEQGGKGAAMNSKFGSTQMYGLNLAVGGLGRKDFNGDVILPDGAHGHLLLVWRPPTTDRDGALQIGIETTGPHAKSTVGYKHTAKSTEATADPESSFGGLKADKVGSGSASMLGVRGRVEKESRGKTDAETNARLVDLNQIGGGWATKLKDLEDQFLNVRKTEAEKRELLVGGRRRFLKEVSW